MKLIDLLLLAALAALAALLGLVAPYDGAAVSCLVVAVGCVGLWFLFHEVDE